MSNLVTVLEAANMLGVSRNAVEYYSHRGRLPVANPPVRLGVARLFKRSHVERLARERFEVGGTLTTAEAAKAIGRSVPTVFNYHSKGLLERAPHCGHSFRFTEESVKRLAKKLGEKA